MKTYKSSKVKPVEYGHWMLPTTDFKKVRTAFIDGDIWRNAQDVCRGLELSPAADESISHHLECLDEDEMRIFAQGHQVDHALSEEFAFGELAVSESGNFKLVLRSDNDLAKILLHFVARKMLPQVQQTGLYLNDTGERPAASEADEDIAEALINLTHAFSRKLNHDRRRESSFAKVPRSSGAPSQGIE
jgi:prophage antirepressor-like protein